MLSEPRIYSACAIVLLYVASSVYFIWIAPRRKSTAVVSESDGGG